MKTLTLRLGVQCFLAFGLLPTFPSAHADDLSDRVEVIRVTKDSASKEALNIPYRAAQHEALKAYFGGLADFARELKEGDKLTKKLNSRIEDGDADALCQALLMPNQEWRAIITRCTKNRFFLCAQEVRAYPDVLSSLRERVREELRAKFDQAGYCKEAF